MFTVEEQGLLSKLIRPENASKHGLIFHGSTFTRRSGIFDWPEGFKLRTGEDRRYFFAPSNTLVEGKNNIVLGVSIPGKPAQPGQVFFVDAHGLTVSEKLYENEFQLATPEYNVSYVETWWWWHINCHYDRKIPMAERAKAVLATLVWYFEQLPNERMDYWLARESTHNLRGKHGIVDISSLFDITLDTPLFSTANKTMISFCQQLKSCGRTEMVRRDDGEPSFLFTDVSKVFDGITQIARVPTNPCSAMQLSHLPPHLRGLKQVARVPTNPCSAEQLSHLPPDLRGLTELFDLDAITVLSPEDVGELSPPCFTSAGGLKFFPPSPVAHPSPHPALEQLDKHRLLELQTEGRLFSIEGESTEVVTGQGADELLTMRQSGVLELRDDVQHVNAHGVA